MPSSGENERWRYVDCGAVDAFENNAQMAVLSRSVAEQQRPIAQTSVWGATHLNVGWFDDVDATLDLDACRRLGIQVVRRPMAGGGTAYYDRDCAVMWGFFFPKGQGHDDLDAEVARFQPVIIDALGRIGLGEVQFEGSSDLRWRQGRKLGGMSAGDFGAVISVGGFLNTNPPDLDRYLQVVRVPDEKFKDKLVKDMREYVCTGSEVRDARLDYADVRDALLGALADAGIELLAEPLSEPEERGLAKISGKIASDDFVRRISSDRFRAAAPSDTRVGFGNHKGRKLCRAGVAVDDGERIAAAMMAGDMHVAPPDTLDRVAAALVGAKASDDTDVRARIAGVFDADDVHQADATMGVTTDDLAQAVATAVRDANRERA